MAPSSKSSVPTQRPRVSRSEAVRWLRERLLELSGEAGAVCEAAARQRVFCRGLAQWSDAELARRFPWIVAATPGIARADLEERAHAWLRRRENRDEGRIACDALSEGRIPCAGWNEFYEAELAGFLEELTGTSVQVVPDP